MMKRSKLFSTLLIIAVTIALANVGLAQEPSQPQRPRRADQNNAGDPVASPDVQEESETAREGLRRAVANLSDQIGLLATELQKLRKETEINSTAMQLLLYEERLAKLEEKIEAANDQKLQLEAQEQGFQQRMQNIPQELMMRGILRRSEAERAIRAELQNAIEETRNQQTMVQNRIEELHLQAGNLRQHVEMLRKKLDLLTGREPVQRQ